MKKEGKSAALVDKNRAARTLLAKVSIGRWIETPSPYLTGGANNELHGLRAMSAPLCRDRNLAQALRTRFGRGHWLRWRVETRHQGGDGFYDEEVNCRGNQHE